MILTGAVAAEGVFATADVSLSADQDTIATLSAKVRLDKNYEGGPIIANVVDVTDVHLLAADPSLREEWQTIFVVVKLTPKHGRCTLAVRAFCEPGSRLALSPWTMERGVVPWDVARRIQRRAAIDAPRHLALSIKRSIRRRQARAGRRDVAVLAAGAMADGSFIEADDLLSAAIAVSPRDPPLLKQYALSAHHSGRNVEAIGRWNEALDAAPRDTMCIAGLACTYREYGDPTIAQHLIAPGLEQFPDDLLILSEAARIASACRRPADAVRLWDRAIALHGAHEAWIISRAQALTAARALAIPMPEIASA